MSAIRRLPPWLALLLPAAAIVFLIVSTIARVRHVEHVSALAGGAEVVVDPASRTGYAGGVRLVVHPERDVNSLEWIVQAQEMVWRGDWRLTQVDYDNAPAGRPVWRMSPYRWWLACVGWVEAAITGRPLAIGVERAALWADPALQLVLAIVVVGLLGRGAGVGGAMWGGLAVVFVFPFGAAFLPGRPDESALVLGCAILSVLPLATVLARPKGRRARVWFALGGVVGGLGLWVAIHVQLLIIGGIAMGGLAAMWARGRVVSSGPDTVSEGGAAIGPWRAWAIAGALTSVLAWLVELAPLGLFAETTRWDAVHPMYALAWLGLGEFLVRVDRGVCLGRRAWTPGTIGAAVAGLVAVAIVPIQLVRVGRGDVLSVGDALTRVCDLPGDPSGGGIAGWFAGTGFALPAVAAVLPILVGLLMVVAVRVVGRRSTVTLSVCVGLGPVLVAVVAAFHRPGGWTLAAGLILVLVGSVVVALRDIGVAARIRSGVAGCALLAVLTGGATVVRSLQVETGASVSAGEVHTLIERDFAWWLARQAPEPDAIVLAPPELTAGLVYYGSLRGLGSPYRENENGFRFSVRLTGATTAAEGEALARSRNVRYIVVPSWDDFLDQYARLGANQVEKTVLALLKQWLPPRWLRAIPYQIPQVEGLAGASVAVFEVVELQDNPTALSRLAEYFAETGQMMQARRLASALKEHLPAEPAAFVARAQVALATRDAGEFRELVEALLPMLEDGSAEALTWDRRVSLALVLAQARHPDLAVAQVQRCLEEMDEPALRLLTNRSMQRFLALLKTHDLEIADPDLARLALRLLPPEVRQD